MLTPSLLAHDGRPIEPHDLAGAWDLDPFLITALTISAVLYIRGYRPGGGERPAARAMAFGAGMVALVVALVSPLEALAGSLASAHMVQHLLLLSVASPLLAWSAPSAALLRGLPGPLRHRFWSGLRRVGLGPRALVALQAPVIWWPAAVASLWLWHAAALYDAALGNEALHHLEHASFLVTSWLLWSAVLGPVRHRLSPGLGVLALFTLTMQGAILAVLMTFARAPWYAYGDTTEAWGLDPLADQHLAGVIMWVPGGLLNAAIGVGLLVQWLRGLDDEAMTTPGHRPPNRPAGDRSRPWPPTPEPPRTVAPDPRGPVGVEG